MPKEQDGPRLRMAYADAAPVIVLDHDGRVVATNQAARLLVGDVEGKPLPPSLTPAASPIASFGQRGEHELRIIRLDAAPDRLRSAFLANMSHELRTPLTAVLGFARLLRSGRGGTLTDRQTHYVERVLAGGEHLLHLVTELLDLARLEAGRLDLRPEDTDLRALAEEVVTTLRPLAESRGVALHLVGAPTLPAFTDPLRAKQILYNYLSNAIKFTPQGGTVRVRVQRSGRSHGRLEVEDTGIGIPKEEQASLFTEFTQIENPLSDASTGSGLGLAITKRITEALGGTVGMRSEPGKGSVFWARLPLVASPGAQPRRPPAAETDGKGI